MTFESFGVGRSGSEQVLEHSVCLKTTSETLKARLLFARTTPYNIQLALAGSDCLTHPL